MYLSPDIDADGLHPIEKMVRAIKEVPRPQNITELKLFLGIITLAAKRRQKGMVIILCVCNLYVCLSVRKFLGKLQTLVAQMSYWQTSNYTRIKNTHRRLLKSFGYKVMTIYITHGYCFQTGEDSLGQLDTSKHNCYCIMAITSKALHQIKHN